MIVSLARLSLILVFLAAGIFGAVMIAGGWSEFLAIANPWHEAPAGLAGVAAAFFGLALFFLPIWLLLKVTDALNPGGRGA